MVGGVRPQLGTGAGGEGVGVGVGVGACAVPAFAACPLPKSSGSTAALLRANRTPPVHSLERTDRPSPMPSRIAHRPSPSRPAPPPKKPFPLRPRPRPADVTRLVARRRPRCSIDASAASARKQATAGDVLDRAATHARPPEHSKRPRCAADPWTGRPPSHGSLPNTRPARNVDDRAAASLPRPRPRRRPRPPAGPHWHNCNLRPPCFVPTVALPHAAAHWASGVLFAALSLLLLGHLRRRLSAFHRQARRSSQAPRVNFACRALPLKLFYFSSALGTMQQDRGPPATHAAELLGVGPAAPVGLASASKRRRLTLLGAPPSRPRSSAVSPSAKCPLFSLCPPACTLYIVHRDLRAPSP